ncbi:MAG: hypothetical protein VB102_02925 [Paludibacter sp.]|nr:hypothetical protein [Paludibacter sp.]
MQHTDFVKISRLNTKLSFEKKIESLLNDIRNKENVLSLTFYGNSTDEKYDEEYQEIRLIAGEIFRENIPLITYIIQTPGTWNEIALETLYKPSFIISATFCDAYGIRYVLMETAKTRILMTEGIQSDFSKTDVGTQAFDIFTKATCVLNKHQMQINDIVRQWNYIGHITGINGEIQHYQKFNDIRADFYQKCDWGSRGYPAATGIGMMTNRLIVNFIALHSFDNHIYIHSLDNPLQTAAHAYSEKVLVGLSKNERHATPKFERAKIISNESFGICFISGTAAIRGEQSMNNQNVTLQTRNTLENIKYLISDINLSENGIRGKISTPSLLRVYVKHKKDFTTVEAEILKLWPETPAIYLEADICREELLVEIEGIAMLHENANMC